jgi:hypothetical protein
MSAFQEMVDLREDLRQEKVAGEESKTKMKALQSKLFKADMNVDQLEEKRLAVEKKLQKAQQDNFKKDMLIQQLQTAAGKSHAADDEQTSVNEASIGTSVTEAEIPIGTPEEALALITKLQTQAEGMRITMRAMEKQLAQAQAAQERAEQEFRGKKGLMGKIFGR